MAVKNISSKEKTVKGMYSLLDSDAYTIDKVLKYCKYDKENILSYENILNKYKDYFDQFLETVNIDKKYYYQPAAFAEFYYGTADLDFLVLYFANMKTLFEFKKPKITALPPTKILEINKLFVEYKNVIKESYNNPIDFIEEPLVEVK